MESRLTKDILRLLDANMNRAVEGIRVLEETARMVLDDSELTRTLKNIRHDLVRILRNENKLDQYSLFARGSDRDVLRDGNTQSERTRDGLVSVIRANAGRAQEAVRAMEEFVKLSYPSLSDQFKSVRFHLYDVEKMLAVRVHAQELLERNRLGLYLIIENSDHVFDVTRAVVEEGAGMVAYEDRVSPGGVCLENARKMMDACGNKDVTTVFHNRLDIALIVSADGVVVDSDYIPVRDCRGIAGEGIVFGYSAPLGSFDRTDAFGGEDFILAAAGFENEKEDTDVLSTLRKLVSRSQVPIVASGNISCENAGKFLECGIQGIAVYASNVTSGETGKFRSVIDSFTN